MVKSDLEKSFSKIRAIINLAYANSAVYRSHYDALDFHPSLFQEPADYFKIPILDREVLKNIPSDAWRTTKKVDLHVHTTSGSSGIPVPIAMRPNERRRIEFGVLRSYIRAGLPLWKETIALRDPIDIKSPNILQRFGFARHAYYSVFAPVEEAYVDICSKYDSIGILKGYASDLAALAQIHRLEAREFPRVSVVVTDSEVLDVSTRELLKNTFQCEVVDFYAAVECGVIAYQNRSSSSYALNSKDVLIEGVLSPRELSPGQYDATVTSLVNRTTPIIRYRIGDIVEFDDAEMANPNFTGKRSLKRIHGKYLNFISLSDGSVVSAHLLKQELTHLGRVDAFQFIQETLTSGTLRFVPNKNFSKAETARILQEFTRGAFRNLVEVQVEAVSDIGPRDTRKFQVVKSLVSQDRFG